MHKKSESNSFKIAKAVGWPARKLIGALIWAGGKIIELLVKIGAKTAKSAAESASRRAAEAKKPKIDAKYSELEVLEEVSGDFGRFENFIMKSKSSIGIILGARGTGKSALGMRILENVIAKTGRKVAAMGFLEESLPSWIKSVGTVEQVENGSFVLVDEGGIVFSARQAMSDANKILSELLLVARHKDLSILFISQNSANLDINAIRQADYLLLRKSSLLQKDFERKKIQQVYEEAKGLFEKYGEQKQKVTYVYSDDFRGIVENELPSFWSEKASKAFKGFTPK